MIMYQSIGWLSVHNQGLISPAGTWGAQIVHLAIELIILRDTYQSP